PAQTAVAQFFANSLGVSGIPDFDVRTSRFDAYVAENPQAFTGISDADKPQVVQQVKRLQRIFQLSTNPNTASALLSAGLDSAHGIANMPRNSFLAQHAVALGSADEAAAIYERAQHINARTLHVY